MAAEALTAKRRAACRIGLPPSTACTIRSRRSWDKGAVMINSTALTPSTLESEHLINGPCCVKSLSDRHVAEFLLLFVVSAGLPHHAIREDAASPSRTRDPPQETLTALLTASPLPSSRRRDLRGAGPISPCSKPFPSLSALRRRGLPAPAEGRAIHPHAVENDRKLARQRHLRSLHAAPLGHLRNCLRATSRARTSWAGIDLQWTGRNQPMRSSWAMPRASLRSVLTIIAESAAFTGLVSSSTASNPALTRAAWSHCDKGPASRPMRTSGRLSPLRNVISASGSLATFASRTICPVASTMQMLLCSNDTSIPAK